MNWDYIAGFFDGEGNILYARSVKTRLSFYNTNQDVLIRIQNFLNRYKILSYIYSRRRKANWKIAYELRINRYRDCEKILNYFSKKTIVKNYASNVAIDGSL